MVGMAAPSPRLPNRFPCWCRAIYSWGGESKKDLGFVEGDLIECLNAGDGSWWMGRLRRDKRAMGLFPSNFVQVLEESFVPVSRATSPLPGQNGSGSISRGPSPNPTPKKAARRPFQSYSTPTPQTSSKSLHSTNTADSANPSRQNSFNIQASHQDTFRYNSGYHSRSPSPAVPLHLHEMKRNASPTTYHDLGSSPPPPPPPPHRIIYTNTASRTTPSPTPSMNDRYPPMSQGHSPAPYSPNVHGQTPSPLRDAMDDVMTSLNGMAVRQATPSPSPERPLDPWSPEAFEELRTNSKGRGYDRPEIFQGLGMSGESESRFDSGYGTQQEEPCPDDENEPPYLSTYVARMEDRLLNMQDESKMVEGCKTQDNDMGPPPVPPPKNSPYQPRSESTLNNRAPAADAERKLRNRKSAFELGKEMVGRTFTTKSTVTNASNGTQSSSSTTSTQMTSQSIMSGQSAGGFSATSAGSLARRKGWGSIRGLRPSSVVGFRQDRSIASQGGGSYSRPMTPLTGISYHSSHNSRPASAVPPEWAGSVAESSGPLGGFSGVPQVKPKKSGFLRKLMESAKTGAASARGSIAAGQVDSSRSPVKSMFPKGATAISGGSAARDMGLGGSDGSGTIDWVRIRRDVNRSNSLSRNEKVERAERCQMLDHPVIAPVDELFELAEGDEGLDGMPISEPTNFQTVTNLQLVDKNTRFVTSLPPMTNPTSLAQGYVCRPYRSDVQRFRAIFTWCSERVAWEEDFEGEIDTRRVIQMRRGCAEEVAVLVMELCAAVGLHAEVIRGYLKPPGEVIDLDNIPRPNHWWNAVLVDNEWRIMDCALASPTNPKRSLYSGAPSQAAETFYFLTRPLEICYTHIPSIPTQQHIVPPIPHSILLALPCAMPPFFRDGLQLENFDTSLHHLDSLELLHLHLTVPPEIECMAEVSVRAYARDSDGDLFESGETITKRALAQAEWIGGRKRYTIKALLPADEGHGVLNVYAGTRGLMISIKDNPHPLAFALPIVHTGSNPPYDFFTRHPTPHAQRHDLYVAQPQCKILAINNTFVFAVRQHPSSSACVSPAPGCPSPMPFARPGSAMSMASSSGSGSAVGYYSNQPGGAERLLKPAKLAIQAPGGKILRLTRKVESATAAAGEGEGDGGTWETIIKVGERGVWRGLVLADRSARWCVFGEWECV